ncbi:UBP-type zinc finger domain-containing protein [Actinosynnema sp. NPDC023587]|uniref:UBP-type zinc finger domain-containing protein n=1 Tax=Actinosynnema sp. NPDC023587 TaxID=3154695 RepID=UPI0033F75D3C
MTCPHVDALPGAVSPSSSEGCADCLAAGERNWAHLRMCLTCGHVACCDSSPRRHATAHFHAEGHPVMRSFEPGEDWRWCYVDARVV